MGLLQGPPESLHCWTSGGGGVGKLQPGLLAEHISTLWLSHRWAAGTAPVVLTGVSEGGLEDVVYHLAMLGHLPEAEADRLRAYPKSLSRWMANTGQKKFTALLLNPTARRFASLLLVQRVRTALDCAGVLPPGPPRGGNLAGSGARARTYRATALPHMRIPED